MASLLSAKQISSLMRIKRKQYVESIVGIGKTLVRPKNSGPGAVGILTQRNPIVLVFTIKYMPNRAVLTARKQFHASNLQLRKVPNSVVKSAARHSPFEWMMSGPTLIAVPHLGKTFTLQETVELAKKFAEDPFLSKGMLFTGLVHHNIFMTPKRVAEVDFEGAKLIPGAIAAPAVGLLQTLFMARGIPLLATLNTYQRKLAKEGNEDAIKALEEADKKQ